MKFFAQFYVKCNFEQDTFQSKNSKRITIMNKETLTVVKYLRVVLLSRRKCRTVCGNHLHAFHHLPFSILMRQICILFLLQKIVHFKNTLQCVEKAIPSVYIFLIYQDFVSSCVVKNMIDKFEVATRGCLHQNSSPICRRLTTGAVID